MGRDKTQNNGMVLLFVGTRPEAIKMIPIYLALKQSKIPTFLCSSGQHDKLLRDILELFQITPDLDFEIMKPNQDFFYITQAVLAKSKELFEQIKPSLVIVQGDTTSSMAAALAAFYKKIPIAHVEAGLRSGNIYAPFPEEMNRRLISRLASYHFAPTKTAVSNLVAEGISEESIFCTGNTVIDALFEIRNKIARKEISLQSSIVEYVKNIRALEHKLILVTMHRRESFDTGLRTVIEALKKALKRYPNLHIIYPVHPNPVIQHILEESELNITPNIVITPPLLYPDLVYLLDIVDGVATDSGGIQEEAVTLNKPVLVLRNETDRPEAVQEGVAVLVGTNEDRILEGIQKIMQGLFKTGGVESLLYGDGKASQKIISIILKMAVEGNKLTQSFEP